MMAVEMRATASLVPYPNNPRSNACAVDAVADSLRQFGFRQPIVVDEAGVIVCGHTRWQAAKKLAMAEVPVHVAVDLTPAQIRAYRIADNKTAELAEWDLEKLAAELGELKAFDIDPLELGFDAKELRELLPADELTDPDAIPENAPAVTARGDLWILGEHRLLCGDSTSADDVARLMNGEKADLCFTSPPYGQQRDYTKDSDCSDWDKLMRGVFENLPMTDAGQVLVNLGMIHRDGEWIPYWDGWIAWMREQGWRRFGWYVWDKLSGMPGDWNGRLAPSHEFIWHFNKQVVYPEKFVECKYAGIVVASTTRYVDGSLRVHTGTKRGDAVQSHKIHDNVFRCGNSKGHQLDHPATFPIALPAIAMQSWHGTAYEPFCGSGTTLIAAEQLGRKCYGMEISPAYCDVIVKRWEEFTGKTAERVSQGT